eukprot:4673718-Ditylum_brightwellii.AAC.1
MADGQKDDSDRKKNKNSLPSAEDAFGLQKFAAMEQFKLLDHLQLDVAKNFSMTPQYSDDGSTVEAQTYTAIVQLDRDIEFDEMGRASLPESVFSEHSLQPTLPTNIYADDDPPVVKMQEQETKSS